MDRFWAVLDTEFFIRSVEFDILIGMTQNILQRCLSERPTQEDDRAVFRWVDFWAPHIAADTSAVSDMLGQMDEEADLPDDLLALFGGVLDAMRMNRENLEKDAVLVFALIDEWLGAKAASGRLDNPCKMALCQAFIRAGLEPPDSIRIGPDAPDSEESPGGMEMPDIEALVRDLIPDDVTGYAAYMVLREGIGAMPRGAAALLVSHMVAQAAPKLISLGRYFLLDPAAEMRVAAAEGFAELAHAGAIDAGTLSDLIRLRKWLPDKETKSTLDRGISEALLREASGGLVPRPWRRHRLLSSLPDGTGSQSIVASVSRGSQKCIATLLLKTGHGIKDAYAIPCTSASDQRGTLAEIEEAMPVYEVTPEYLPLALAAALGEGLAKGLTPAPGFVDVSEMMGLGDLSPQEHGSVSRLGIADPEGHLDGLSAAKRGRLIGQSIKWARDHEMSSSWFVTDASLSAALDAARTEREAEKVVWATLDAQRGFWSSHFARSAAILRHAGEDDWLSFAGVVQGLENGRSLKRIPIFEVIAALTLDVAEQNGIEDLAMDEGLPDGPFAYEGFDQGIEPEATGELGRLLRKAPLSPDMIDGYLTATIVAPRFITPADWLPPLLDGINLPEGDKLQRVLDIIMLRYGEIRNGLFDRQTGSGIKKRSARKFADWLTGFAHATALTAAWPKRALSRDDQKILELINRGAQGEDIRATLKPLLPGWLDAMAAKAVDW